ncbi:hypothetical protein BC351_01145 [Paenibacillus ferrarius]|uniref:Uncharacterized protein n=1 Tax=Paenibacillus ferrarius TaxID=1469647 RepID=A0A1V4HSM0_9BACL|nr:hypothetical protein [Paenibacillus ferrarius]OPH61877.1 hypothetical protein BC351_01145 [Paenibacillus ferrarius]
MDIHSGLEVAALMKPFDKAICIMGTYRNCEIEMNQWGDVCWATNGVVIGLDRYFQTGKWKLI